MTIFSQDNFIFALSEIFHQSFKDYPNDNGMCYKLWAAMANKKWKNKEERQISYSYSFRTAGGILA